MVDIVTRLGKGSPLTNAEVDANFTNLAEVSGVTGEPMGHEDRTTSTISFNASTRTFTIAPVASSFTVWCKGKKVVVSSARTVTIPNTTGMYSIYFDSTGALAAKSGYFTFAEEAPTAYIYWNATTGTAPYFGDERHGVVLDWQTHEYLHRTRGAALASGFSASGYVLGGNGSSNTHAQLTIEGGTFFDEDMKIIVTATNTPTAGTWEQDLLSPARIPVLHLQGTAWVMDSPTDYPLKQGTSRPQYNAYSGGVWSTADVANNKYSTTWVLATNNLTYPVIAIIGQAQSDLQSAAEAVDFTELQLPGFPSVEFRPLYKLVFQCADSCTNAVHASLVSITDIRSIAAAGTAASIVSDHGNLTGLSDDDHPQYIHVDTLRTVSAAVKASFLPSQTSNDGKFLQTNGTATSWAALSSSNVTTALGFTPYNATNPSGFISGITSGMVTTALGFTPYNATNPSGYVSAAGARGALSVTGAGSYDSATGVINIVGGVTSFNTRTGAITLSSSDVTTALGYTPYNSSNPNGYISGITSGMVTTALGFTPYNNSNPSGYITSSALSGYLTSASAASTYLPLAGGTLTGNRPIGFDTSGGGITIKGDAGGWGMGLYFKGSDDVVKGSFGALGGGSGFSYLWAGVAYNNTWMTFTSGQINSSVALTQGNNQVLHAGNYGSYALPLSGGTLSGTLTIGSRLSMFDDGNVHIHATSGPMWLNASDGSWINLNAQTGGHARVSRDFYVSGGSGGNYGNRLIVGNTDVSYSLQDTNARPTIQIHGQYPVLSLNHTVTSNGSHGPTVQFTANGTGSQFVIGMNGTGTNLLMGYSSAGDWNPHNGISGYNGTSFFEATTDGYLGLGAPGDWGGSGGGHPEYHLHFKGFNKAATSHAALFQNTTNGTNNGAGFCFLNDYGNHSWGIVAEYRISGTGDRPSILFSTGQSSTTWSVGYGAGDDQFRINQNHGHRNSGWGSERFRIDTGGTSYFNGNVNIHAGNYNSYAPTLTGGNASGTWGISVSGSASSASYLLTAYAGGQQTNPQVYFNSDVGLKAAMTGMPYVWSDTLWINGYGGGDVPNMCALHTSRGGVPRMWITTQSNRSTSYGTFYQFLTDWNYSDYAVPLSGGTMSGNLRINGGGSDSGLGIGYTASGYARIRYYQDGTNNQTMHIFGTSWQGGGFTNNSAGAINIEGSSGVTFGAWNSPAMAINSAGEMWLRNNLYLGYSGTYTIGTNVWAGSSGYPGYSYAGGNHRFGFSSTGGVIDVYADGNFYATDNAYLVLHAANYSSYALPLSGGSTSGGIHAVVNLGSGNGATPASPWLNNNLEARTTDGSAAVIALHRSGYSHVALVHKNTNELMLNMNSGEYPVLHSGNYSSYAAPASHTQSVTTLSDRPSWFGGGSFIANQSDANAWHNSGFYENGGSGSNWPNGSGTWYNSINVRHSNQGNYHGFQLAMSYYDNYLYWRSYQGSGTFQSWVRGLSSANYSDYALPLSGGNLSGTLSFQQPVGLGFANGQYIKDNGGGGLVIYSGAAVNINGTSITINGNTAIHAGNYSSYALPLSGGTTNGSVYITGNGNTGSYNNVGLNVYSTNSGTGANMAFHRSGIYAINFGLDSDNIIRFGGWSAAANRLQMDMSGNLTMAGNVTAYSDERLKKDWAVLPSNFIEHLAKVKSGTYTRIDSEERQVGVSAQGLQEFLEEAVQTDAVGMLSVNYGGAALASAVELAKRVVDQEKRIAQLESLIHKLLGD